MKIKVLLFAMIGIFIFNPSLICQPYGKKLKAIEIKHAITWSSHFDSIFNGKDAYIVHEFGVPLGIPDGKGYYISKGFWQTYNYMNHLGEDWSGVGGGNTDFGDTIYAIADGYVTFSEDLEFTWGGVVSIVHKVENQIALFSDKSIVHDTCKLERGKYRYIESFYAHCENELVKVGEWVRKGQPISTMGNSGGRFEAHLHLELRPKAGTKIFDGGGYAKVPDGFINPEEFMRVYNGKKD